MAVYGSAWSTLVQIFQDTGYGMLPVDDLLYTDFALITKKTGQPFVAPALTQDSVTDFGYGWYEFHWSVSDMDTIGEFYYKIIPGIVGGVYVEGKFDVMPPPMYANNVHPTCIITGNIVDLSGHAQLGTPVVFRPKNVPIVVGVSLIGASRILTYPDAYGNFSVELIRNVQAIVEIESSGIRHLITVPDLPTANILSLLPPVPPQY